MSELKPRPCPICGAELKIYGPEDWRPTFYDPDSGGDPYNAVCDCGFSFSTGTYDYAEFVAALNRRAQPANEPCSDCSGIVYRQSNSGKIIPADQRCGEKITPPCYQPDGDGCAYQTYGDNDDEPIDQCKACPLCYSDKVRHATNKPLTPDEMNALDHEPIYVLHTGGKWAMNGWHIATASSYQNHGRCDLEIDNGNATIDMQNYGKTWLAYRPQAGR